MVYIRMEADISALTYPNKWQAVCYSANAGEEGGPGGGGLREEIKEEGRETGEGVSTQEERRSDPIKSSFPSLALSHGGVETPVSIPG